MILSISSSGGDIMSMHIETYRCRFIPMQHRAIVENAVNVAMNEVIKDDKETKKTFITDALATCSAIAFYSTAPGFTMAFTHMSSESTSDDDRRKKDILNEMLEFALNTIDKSKLQMTISPSFVKDEHLIDFICNWAHENQVNCLVLKGGDSAIFDINCDGMPHFISTATLNYKEHQKGYFGHGIVLDSSNAQLNMNKYQKNLGCSVC